MEKGASYLSKMSTERHESVLPSVHRLGMDA
jgi:hypothetical protein